jgi:hypothetical protein
MPMPFFVAFRLFVVAKNGFSPARFFHPYCGNEEMSSGLLAAAQSLLIVLEELLSSSAPFIGVLFPAYVPLVSALIFAWSNLTSRIPSLLVPNQPSRHWTAALIFICRNFLHSSKEIQMHKATSIRPLSALLCGTPILTILVSVVPDSFGQQLTGSSSLSSAAPGSVSFQPVTYNSSSNAGPSSLVSLFADSEASGQEQSSQYGQYGHRRYTDSSHNADGSDRWTLAAGAGFTVPVGIRTNI